MDPRVASLWAGFRMHTRLGLNCFDGVDDAIARERPGGGVNSMGFVALHLVEARSFLLGLLGAPAEPPFPEFRAIHSIEELERYPPLAAVLDAWQALGDRLETTLAAVDAEILEADSSQAFPLADGSVLGAVTFLFHHEAYHLGQLGLLRRLHGLDSMAYT